MHILVVKTSSLGDVIHTLPALTDAGKAIPTLKVDWVVEEAFREIPAWHPLVETVIPVAWRRWRKKITSADTWREWQHFRQLLTAKHYDLIIDAQGLLKSAVLTWMSKGKRVGLAQGSARESVASLFYQQRITVAREQHAITRLRNLFSQALAYPLPHDLPQYGIDRHHIFGTDENEQTKPYIVFLHGTTWDTKHWPEEYWIELANKVHQAGYLVKLPWGNALEKARAKRIAAACSSAEILPQLTLVKMAAVLARARACVAVDTGLGHLAAALAVPTISLYGPTNPILTGALGESQIHRQVQYPCSPCLKRICIHHVNQPSPGKPAPCFTTLQPGSIWASLLSVL